MTENNARLLILELPFLYFLAVATASNLSFSAPAIVRHHVGTPASLLSFLCFYILVERLSLLINHCFKVIRKIVDMTLKKMNLHTHIAP